MEATKSFYEEYGQRRKEDPLEMDYDRLAAEWKVDNILALMPQIQSIRTMLEFGCGSGQVMRAFSKRHYFERIVGIDISETQLSIAKREVPEAMFICGDEHTMLGLVRNIELLLLIDVLEHLSDPIAFLRRVADSTNLVILKLPIEKCWITEVQRIWGRGLCLGTKEHPAGHLFEWNRRDALALFRQSGLKILKYSLATPPTELRYHPLFNREGGTSKWQFPRLANRMVEKATYRWIRPLHRRLYGASMFALCRRCFRNQLPNPGGGLKSSS